MTRLELLQTATLELIERYEALGDVKVKIITFATSAQEVGNTSQWMTAAEAKAAIIGLNASGNTNYDAALTTAQSAFADPGKLPDGDNVSYFVSDGKPNRPSGDVGIDSAEQTAWETFLNTNDIKSYALGMGTGLGSAEQGDLDPIAYDGTGSGTNTDAIIVQNEGVIPTLIDTVPQATAISGNLVMDGGSGFGADGGYVKSILVEGTTYTYDPAGGGSIAFSGGANHGVFDTATNTLTVTLQDDGAILAVDMDDGAYTYTAPDGAASSAVVNFTLADHDGDTASNTLSVGVDPADAPLIVRDDRVLTNQPGVPGKDTVTIPMWALLANDTGPNGQPVTLTGVSGAVDGAVAISGAAVIFTEESAGATDGGSFTYTAQAGGVSDTANVQVIRGDLVNDNPLIGSWTSQILIGRDGSNDIIEAREGNDVLLGLGGDDTLKGETGNDILAGGLGNDTLDGGAGNDTATYIDSATAVNASLATNTATGEGNDTFISIENLTGSAFNDILTGDGNANTLAGLAGHDTLSGGGGNDLLIGGPGNDTMTGGAGADTFKWGQGDLAGSTTGDVITDFSVGAGDKLDIADLLTGYVAGVSDPGDFVQFETSGSNTVVKVDVNGGGDSFVTLATLNGVTGQTVAGMITSGHLVVTHDTP
jgi:large repetitive protein